MHVDPQREEENQVKREELRGPGAGKRSDWERWAGFGVSSPDDPGGGWAGVRGAGSGLRVHVILKSCGHERQQQCQPPRTYATTALMGTVQPLVSRLDSYPLCHGVLMFDITLCMDWHTAHRCNAHYMTLRRAHSPYLFTIKKLILKPALNVNTIPASMRYLGTVNIFSSSRGKIFLDMFRHDWGCVHIGPVIWNSSWLASKSVGCSGFFLFAFLELTGVAPCPHGTGKGVLHSAAFHHCTYTPTCWWYTDKNSTWAPKSPENNHNV